MADFGVNSVANLDNPLPGMRETDYSRQVREEDREQKRQQAENPPEPPAGRSSHQNPLGGRLDIHV